MKKIVNISENVIGIALWAAAIWLLFNYWYILAGIIYIFIGMFIVMFYDNPPEWTDRYPKLGNIFFFSLIFLWGPAIIIGTIYSIFISPIFKTFKKNK